MYNKLENEIKTLTLLITRSEEPRVGSNDKFYVLADAVSDEDHPQHYIYKAIEEAHGEMLPDDFIYEHVADVLTHLGDFIRDKDEYEIDDIEIDDELADIYMDWHQPTGYDLSNYGLTLWLGAGGGYRYELVDDVIADFGITSVKGIPSLSITEVLEIAYQKEKANTEYVIVQAIANHLSQ